LTLTRGRINAAAMGDDPQDVNDLSFEAALKRLEEIVRKLESGEAPLDEAIALYAEGDRLKQQCEARLQAAQAKIEQIQFGRDGAPTGTVPFGEE
jgi:exodeoxyribonuclease VII small subunit